MSYPFKVGDKGNLRVDVYDRATPPAHVAPTTITGQIVAPDGTTSTVTLANGGTGIYTGSYSFTQVGVHYFKASTTGTYQAADDLAIVVHPVGGD